MWLSKTNQSIVFCLHFFFSSRLEPLHIFPFCSDWVCFFVSVSVSFIFSLVFASMRDKHDLVETLDLKNWNFYNIYALKMVS